MSEVRLREGESLESALKRFKKKTAMAGVMSEIRKREHYEKPRVRMKCFICHLKKLYLAI